MSDTPRTDDEWPCYECGAVAMGSCGKVGCAAMRQQLNEKNAEIERLSFCLANEQSKRKELWDWIGRVRHLGTALFSHFTPSHLDHISQSTCGTELADALKCPEQMK